MSSNDQASAAEEIAHDDLCPVCHLLLFDPVKTQCNHVLCASCMSQWADASATASIAPSSLNLDLSDFDTSFDAIEANCPMCRTLTTASPDNHLRRALKSRYTVTYAERREEERDGREVERDDGTEGVTILIGNRHRLVGGTGEERNKHDWTFFVRMSRPEMVEEVRVHLHPSFQPPNVVLTDPPFEIRRLGWGYFTVTAQIVLREPYSWVSDDPAQRSRKDMLRLAWSLYFHGAGKQGRVRAKVKKVEGDPMDVDDQSRELVFWSYLDQDGV